MISVILPFSGAEKDLLRHQLHALSMQSYRNLIEIVVVCNKSTLCLEDISVVGIKAHMKLILVHAEDQFGASYARNLGAQNSHGDILLFCDADDLVHPNWLSELEKGLYTYDLVGGSIEPFVEISGNHYRYPRTTSLSIKFGYLPFAISANFGISRRVFDKLGGFEATVYGSEDTDICWRAQNQGFSLGFIYEALVSYRLRNSSLATFLQFYRYGTSDFTLVRKFNLSAIRTFPLIQIAKCLIFILFPFLVLNSRFRRTLACNFGYIIGFLHNIRFKGQITRQ